MSRITLGSSDLLEYNPAYGVLICRECEYAIQKSAVQSHLLRHKIYRGERQNLIASIARFELREPDDVSLPDRTTRPIAALPVLDGYHCLHSGCQNICASVKRMRRHWVDVHGGAEGFDTMAREIKMQTFFRGTKIRYFEVSPDLTEQMVDEGETIEEDDLFVDSEGHSSDLQGSDDEQTSYGEEYDDDEVMEDVMGNTSLNAKRVEYPLPGPPPIDLDLETLKSFHDFLLSTRLTLPTPGTNMIETCYWQGRVVPLALSRHWLMSGLLAISEYHAVALEQDEAEAKPHRERARQFFAGFVAGREVASRHVCGSVRTSTHEEERRVGGQIMCVARCAHWALMKPMPNQGFTSFTFHLQNFLATLKFFSLVDRNGNDSTPEEIFARAGQIFRRRSQSGCADEGEDTIALLGRLDKLPSRMSDVFGRPGNVEDVMATLAAIATLVEHYSASFTIDPSVGSPNLVWHSMVQWLSKVPEQFRNMVARHEPAALVVVAFWVSALVARAEKCGYWFLHGLARRLMTEIAGRLEEVEGAVSLIEGLI